MFSPEVGPAENLGDASIRAFPTRLACGSSANLQKGRIKMLQPVSEAVGDLRAAWRGRRIAMAFAHEDVADAYRKTSLGPIWMLISYLLFNCAIVFVAGHPADIPNYIGFVACGLLVFQFMSEVISDGVTLFHREQPYIKGTTLPISIYVFRLTCRSMLRNAYPLAGAVGLLLYSGEIPQRGLALCDRGDSSDYSCNAGGGHCRSHHRRPVARYGLRGPKRSTPVVFPFLQFSGTRPRIPFARSSII